MREPEFDVGPGAIQIRLGVVGVLSNRGGKMLDGLGVAAVDEEKDAPVEIRGGQALVVPRIG